MWQEVDLLSIIEDDKKARVNYLVKFLAII